MLNNPWVSEIVGGTLSGLSVNLFSRFLLSGRDQREYAQKLFGANREVVYAVRPGVSEGMVPTVDVLDALTEATARKYGVDRNDLYQALRLPKSS
jgi:hypothetical protein